MLQLDSIGLSTYRLIGFIRIRNTVMLPYWYRLYSRNSGNFVN